MDILESIDDLRTYRKGKNLAFVPTMGALHEGHLSLVREGLNRADYCLPYIFLNPAQFAPHEDLSKYPRTLEADLEKLRSAGAQAVYLPKAAEIYPDGFAATVHIDGITAPLEGECRPHFFDGVCTVLTKMFLHAMPDIALFGEKDYQQLLVIKKLVRDLDFPIEIIGIETARDENGLALSSRNVYLTEKDYAIAIQLNKILAQLGSHDDDWGKQALLEAGFDKVDYCTVRDANTLLLPSAQTRKKRALAAATIGSTRLIDNLPV